MLVEEVKMFICPETGKLFTTKAQATRSANKASAARELQEEKNKLALIAKEEKDKLRNYVRLNLDNINNLQDMLVEKAKEFYDIDIENLSIRLYFSEIVSNSHSCPINGFMNWSGRDKGKPTGYPGWSGQIRATVKAPKLLISNRCSFSDSAGDILFNNHNSCFAGFYTGTGCPGSTKGEYDMNISFQLFLQDFPLLQEKYDQYVIEKNKVINNEVLTSKLHNLAYNYAINDKGYLSAQNKISLLQNQLYELQRNLIDEYILDNSIVLEDISDNYEKLKSNFRGYY